VSGSAKRCAPPGTRQRGTLLQIGPLADLLAERHRIITANWKNACVNTIVAHLLTRANEILDRIDFTPDGLRADLGDRRLAPRYLYSAAELIDHAADLSPREPCASTRASAAGASSQNVSRRSGQ
jgi:hypothetical protein